jgi:hypothetical protein
MAASSTHRQRCRQRLRKKTEAMLRARIIMAAAKLQLAPRKVNA